MSAGGRRCGQYIRTYGVSCYDEKTRQGLLRHLWCPGTNGAGQSLVCIIVNGEEKLPHEAELVSLLRQAVPDAVGVVLGGEHPANRRGAGPGIPETLGGEKCADSDHLCGLTFRLSVPSFFQVNRPMAELLYETALDFAGLTGRELVLDLYCDAGTISQVMASGRRESSVRRSCRRPSRTPGRTPGATAWENAGFFCGDASAVAATWPPRDCGLTICVDLPRKGLAPGGGGRGGGHVAPEDRVCFPATRPPWPGT